MKKTETKTRVWKRTTGKGVTMRPFCEACGYPNDKWECVACGHEQLGTDSLARQSPPAGGSVLAIACVLLQKQVGTALKTSITQHWRVGIDDETRMRGIAVAEALKAKPGMGVIDVLTKIIRIPNAAARTTGRAMKKRASTTEV